MWDRIAAVVLFAAFAADCAVLTLRNVHMLQLNSYRPERYGRWMKAHRPELWRTYGWLLIALAAGGVQLLLALLYGRWLGLAPRGKRG